MIVSAQTFRGRNRFADDDDKTEESVYPSEQDSIKPVGSCAESDYDCGESLT